MDLPWGDEKSRTFVTNVGLITSNGPHGQNIMAAEWTHHVSYSPGMVAVHIGHGKTAYENIKDSREFGVNLAAFDQNIISSIAGGASGKDTDKIKVLEDMGVEFYKGKKIGASMIKDAALNIECKLIKIIDIGDHAMFVGEVIEASASGKEPLAYYDGKYWKLESQIKKPPQDVLDKIEKLIKKHEKK